MALAKLTVHSGWHERHWCPVQAQLTLETDVSLDRLILRDEIDNTTVPVQAWSEEEGQIALAWIVEAMASQQTRTYTLQVADQPYSPEQGVRLADSGPGKLDVHLGGQHFTTYNFGPEVIRPYLYPVLTSDGTGITRNWPMVEDAPGETTDHIHHRGIWTAHGEVKEANGVVNNWGEGEGHGWQIHRAFDRRFNGPVAGGFTQQLDWTDHQKRVNMTETRRMTFYQTAGPVRLFDYIVTLQAAAGEITLADTKEAGLISVRIAPSMDAKNQAGGQIENGYGAMQEGETWGKRAPWCDYAGPIGEKWSGICFMDHLTNPRYPTYWHVRDYGLMTANCFGLHDYTGDPNQRWDLVIPAGQSLTWRYRALIHAGDAKTAQVAGHYHNFINPPLVEGR